MRKVFLDASVLIAGSASSTGASRAVLLLAEVGLFQAIVSEQVLEECRRNLIKKLPDAIPTYEEILFKLNLIVLSNPIPAECARWQRIIEPKDTPILAAAVLHKVDRLLTLNTRDFTQEVSIQTKLTIQTPADFIQETRKILEEGMK